jgi:hypothetical protein
VRKREAQVLGQKLPDVRAADALGVLDLDDKEDVNGTKSGIVAGSHVLVQRLNSCELEKTFPVWGAAQ